MCSYPTEKCKSIYSHVLVFLKEDLLYRETEFGKKVAQEIDMVQESNYIQFIREVLQNNEIHSIVRDSTLIEDMSPHAKEHFALIIKK